MYGTEVSLGSLTIRGNATPPKPDPRSHVVTSKVTTHVVRAIDEAATAQGVSRSEFIFNALVASLSR